MPVFAEDPSQLSKSRLKSDLIAHNVALPPAQSKKEIYVELHMKHIDQKNAADFSSDEEDPGQDEGPEDAGILDPSVLTDDDLKAALLKHGVKAGPIVASTRALYEKKLRTLLQSDGHDTQNGAEEAVLYSDSEEEEENAEDKNEESATRTCHTFCTFCDLGVCAYHFSATRRRPIKGAAGRPIQYVYPDTPVSPTTLERQEVERRLVPVYIQMFVFLIVACVLYFIYICVEDSSFSPLMALLDRCITSYLLL
uniref:Zgc:92287 n=1 Tax=Sphaeramia orbicularis TaxID=375764 RepID=A0A673CDB9_9TELE